MFLCLWLRDIFHRLITSQSLQSSMGVVLYVCAHSAGVDRFGCHPPTRLQPPPWPPPVSAPFLPFSILHPVLAIACCVRASVQFPLQPRHSCIQSIHEYVFALAVLIRLTFQTPLSLPLFRPLYHCPSALAQLYWAVSVFDPWPCCNSVTEVIADRFLWKRHCHVWQSIVAPRQLTADGCFVRATMHSSQRGPAAKGKGWIWESGCVKVCMGDIRLLQEMWNSSV